MCTHSVNSTTVCCTFRLHVTSIPPTYTPVLCFVFCFIPGVDIELPAVRRRVDLRRRVLTPRECDNLGLVSGVTEQEEVLLRFSMKEAVYKAAHPFLRRPLGFKDVSTSRLVYTPVCVECGGRHAGEIVVISAACVGTAEKCHNSLSRLKGPR